MELLDIVDEENNLTGEKCDRKIVHEKGLWHREVAIFVVNSKNEILIQKRSANKKLAPNMWSLTAGHIESGESDFDAAVRETYEELGIENLKPEDFEFLGVVKAHRISGDIINNHFKSIFLLKTEKNIDEFKIQENELSEVKYISIDKLKNDLIKNETKYKSDFTKIFFEKYFEEILDIIQRKYS